MRSALNNLQSTVTGFEKITKENVYKVCDQPHPEYVAQIISHCTKGEFDQACAIVANLWKDGYNVFDIVSMMTRLVQTHDISEELKLIYLKEIAILKMRLLEGVDSLLQIDGFIAVLCDLAKGFQGPKGP